MGRIRSAYVAGNQTVHHLIGGSLLVAGAGITAKYGNDLLNASGRSERLADQISDVVANQKRKRVPVSINLEKVEARIFEKKGFLLMTPQELLEYSADARGGARLMPWELSAIEEVRAVPARTPSLGVAARYEAATAVEAALTRRVLLGAGLMVAGTVVAAAPEISAAPIANTLAQWASHPEEALAFALESPKEFCAVIHQKVDGAVAQRDVAKFRRAIEESIQRYIHREVEGAKIADQKRKEIPQTKSDATRREPAMRPPLKTDSAN